MLRIVVVMLILLSPAPALAQELGDVLRETGRAKVKAVIDPQTIQLDNGRTIWLAGLDFPDLNPRKAGELSIKAKAILEDFLKGQQVKIYQTKTQDLGRMNRMGHDIAHLEKDEIWVQGLLLELGLARVRTTQRNRDLAAAMYEKETAARLEGIGIWESEGAILTPETAENHIGSFQLVEGRIESVTLNKNRLYLNFGKNWRTDFTIMVAPMDRRLFTRAGIDPMQWGGQRVRVRGWLERYNGPMIKVDHPEAIELLPGKP